MARRALWAAVATVVLATTAALPASDAQLDVSIATAALSMQARGSAHECASGDGLPYRGDILPYLRSSDDVTVPPGRYSIGDPSETGRKHEVDEDRDDWVTVKADIPGSVVVDGSTNQGVVVFAGNGSGNAKRSQKIVVAGIHWIATSVMFESTQDVSLWYTCHEYTPQQWHENVMAAAQNAEVELPATGPKDPHGDGGGVYSFGPGAPEWQRISSQLGTFLPTGIRGGATAEGASRDIRFFGVDVGPAADDGIYMGSTWNLVIQGTRIRDVSELYPQPDGDAISVDPGPVFGDEKDQFHNDGIQIGRSGYRPTILDSWSANRIMFNKTPTPVRSGWELVVRRSWFGSTPQINTGGADQVANRSDDPAFADWDQGNAGGPWRSEAIAAVVAYPNENHTPEMMSAEFSDIMFIAHKGSEFHYELPGTGIRPDGPSYFPNLELNRITTSTLGLGHRDIFTDADFIARHPQNPANIWRAVHPYDAMSSFTGLTAESFVDPGAVEGGGTDPSSLGDVNCSGVIDIGDALMIAQYSVNTRTDSGGCPLAAPRTEINLSTADVSNDGEVTIGDALLVAQCSVGVSNIACPE